MRILKIFNGFITNSSSVNFMIATKEELTEELLEERLRGYPETRLQASYYTNRLWQRIALEEEPYEYDFYELTLGKGSFHYYPGIIVSDDPRLFPIHGLKIEKEDFILAIGYFERTPKWQEKYIQNIHLRDMERRMWGVRLYLSSYEIKTIDEITNLCELENVITLHLQGNDIEQIEGLECLDNLRSLDLSGNKIKQVQGLEKLVNLERLHLRGNQITQIENLDLQNLQMLNLSDNQISKIEGLEHLPSLTELNLSKNPIKHLNNLENLSKLKYLSLDDTQIEKIEELERLTSLTSLRLRNTKISKIEGLDALRNLESLNVSHTPISTIEGLENLTRLRSLNIYGSKIPQKLIKELGGKPNDYYGIKNPQKFVEYCKKNK